MTVNDSDTARPLGAERFNKPFYRLLMALGLFEPSRRVNRWLYRVRTQRRALAGQGLVPEQKLTASFVDAIERLRGLNGGKPIGDYMEFGVCYGSSMACMHDALARTGTSGVRQFGFDSFEGLPPETDHQDNQLWSSGQLASSIEFARKLLTRRGVDWSKTFLIKGWFKDTLTPDLVERHGIRHVGIAMIDCDIYTSARDSLAFVEPLVGDHAVFLFDDWHAGGLAEQNLGEKRAFDEFLRRNPDITTTQLPAYDENSAVFLLTRTKARPNA
ncbi:TylF/MycF family methyltransferase [Skermanella rosea]|uniref:TylF/MycF/NovP-related O-methyltransferase n=1 Tax=Skermanella rosea TaxID=1817965 RepID=UPI001932C48A|nr:TylF/MycF/NovP-related O-methyltransferase [Skermanella rosea]UEM02999.1 TylF/MycF family methyltransferase [Skermanella rosea]